METRNPILTETEFVDFCAGCALAFRSVFDAYHKPIYRYVYGITQSEFETEEIVQEGFIQLFANRSRIHSLSGLYPYLFTIVKRMVVVSFRRKMVKQRYEQHLQLNWKEGSFGTEEQIASKELEGLLEDMIQTLPEKQQVVYKMHSVNGYSYDEIASEIGGSRNTIKNQVVEASKRIKIQLKKYYYFLNLLIFIVLI